MSLPQSILLAETRMSDISVRFKPPAVVDNGIGLGTVLFLLVMIAIAVAIYYFVIRQPHIDNSPAGLLNEISRNHGVNSSVSQLLNEIATAAGLQHPAVMLLGQANFQAAVKAAGTKITLNRGQKKTLGIVQRQLFGASR